MTARDSRDESGVVLGVDAVTDGERNPSMEPIRPERDEVAARKGAKAKPEKPAKGAAPKPERAPRPPKASGKGAWPVVALLIVLLVAVSAVGGWLLYKQNQEVNRLASNLGDAQDWINQSKLSLARFEGQLTETDQELAQSGDKVGDKMAFLESEIRKLWGVAYDRNRKAIKANDDQLAKLQKTLEKADGKLSELTSKLDSQAQKLEQLNTQVARIDKVEEAVSGLRADLGQKVDELGSQVSRQAQQQKLALDEVRARVSALERKLRQQDSQAEVAALRKELGDLKTVVDSIDAFRSQITSRLLQLESRVESKGAAGGQ
ncbi:hypothetical protein QQM79_19545 [Marinobacteraceae bacterium S3BR75-40.1]